MNSVTVKLATVEYSSNNTVTRTKFGLPLGATAVAGEFTSCRILPKRPESNRRITHPSLSTRSEEQPVHGRTHGSPEPARRLLNGTEVPRATQCLTSGI